MNLRQPKLRTRFKKGQIVDLWESKYIVADSIISGRQELVLICKHARWSSGQKSIPNHIVNALELKLVRGAQ